MHFPMRRSITALALLFTATGTPALAEAPNAALRYWRAWSQVAPGFAETIGTVEVKSLGDPTWKPTPDQTAAASSLNADLFIRAASIPACNFEPDLREDGPMALLPHLAPMRASVRALMVQARSALQAGDETGATDRIVAGYRAARHVSSEPVLISALVSRAIFVSVEEVARLADAQAALSAESRARIRAALGEFDPADPFRIRAAINMERTEFLGWLRRVTQDPAGPGLDQLLGSLGLDPDARKTMHEHLRDRLRVLAEIAELDSLYDLAARTMGQPEANAIIASISAKAAAKDTSPLLQQLVPAFDRINENFERSLAEHRAAAARYDR